MLFRLGRIQSVRAPRFRTLKLVPLYSTLPDRPGEPPKGLTENGQTIPPAKIHRVTYEYPPPPKRATPIPAQSSSWKRHVPLLIGVGGLLWAVYAFNYFFGDGGSKEQTLLTPTSFTTYRITYKENLTDDMALIEICPKFAAGSSMLKSGATLWNGKRLWSIQVKHPMVQIVRNYTPLPLYFMQSGDPSEKPLLRVMGTAGDDGRMCLLVKKYADGEMSRYLHELPTGSDVEIRGPFVEHQFPYGEADMLKPRQPMLDIPSRMPPEKELDPSANIPRASNLIFYTAGTGIAPVFQALLSPGNPPRGFTHVFHSARYREDIPFERLMLFLESAGRAKFHLFVDNENKFVQIADVPSPVAPPAPSTPAVEAADVGSGSRKHASVVQQFSDRRNRSAYLPGASQAVVCGPPGYITYMSGDPGYNSTNPIGGLLGKRGWTNDNTVRMNDI